MHLDKRTRRQGDTGTGRDFETGGWGDGEMDAVPGNASALRIEAIGKGVQ